MQSPAVPQLLQVHLQPSVQRACVLVGCNPDKTVPCFAHMADLQSTRRDNLQASVTGGTS
jgi:hypothetical protein